jgi:uncharacterized protein (DUF302 family)
MAEEFATTTYLVPEPFETAVQSLRKVLADAGIELVGELDTSSRIRQTLLIGATPCRVLFVATPASFEELGAGPSAAALTPLHIVVSARGPQTEIHLLRAMRPDNILLDQPTMAVFRRLQARVAQAVERIAMRSTLGA